MDLTETVWRERLRKAKLLLCLSTTPWRCIRVWTYTRV